MFQGTCCLPDASTLQWDKQAGGDVVLKHPPAYTGNTKTTGKPVVVGQMVHVKHCT